jgi:hypothetical protein
MRRLHKLWASPWLFKALLGEALVRMGVLTVFRFLPVPGRAQRLTRGHPVSHPGHAVPSSQEICRALDVAARFLPGATCLVKAQAGSAMLNRFGYAAEIKIGVLKESSDLKAHAWLEYQGRVVLGESGNQYTELPKMKPATSGL